MPKRKVGLHIDEAVDEEITRLARTVELPKGDLVSTALAMFMRLPMEARREELRRYMGESIDRAFSTLNESFDEANGRDVETD